MEHLTVLPHYAKRFNEPEYSPSQELLSAFSSMLAANGDIPDYLADKVANIHILNLAGSKGAKQQRILNDLVDFEGLQALNLAGNSRARWATIHPSMKRLKMRNTRTDTDFYYSTLPKLRYLDLESTDTCTDQLIPHELHAEFENLKTLNISWTPVEDFTPEIFPRLRHFSTCCSEFDWPWVRGLNLETLEVHHSMRTTEPADLSVGRVIYRRN